MILNSPRSQFGNKARGLVQLPHHCFSSKEPIENRFEVRDLGRHADNSNWVALTPKTAEPAFQDIRLGFSDNTLVAMEFRDSLDQITRIKFSNSKRNPTFSDDLFQFQVPAGVDVLESK